jgi:hypothetical protein
LVLCLFFAFTFPFKAFTQNGVWKHGLVTDSLTGKIITGAIIKAPGEGKSSISDSAGKFRLFFAHSPYIEVSAEGYQAKTVNGNWSIPNFDVLLVPDKPEVRRKKSTGKKN